MNLIRRNSLSSSNPIEEIVLKLDNPNLTLDEGSGIIEDLAEEITKIYGIEVNLCDVIQQVILFVDSSSDLTEKQKKEAVGFYQQLLERYGRSACLGKYFIFSWLFPSSSEEEKKDFSWKSWLSNTAIGAGTGTPLFHTPILLAMPYMKIFDSSESPYVQEDDGSISGKQLAGFFCIVSGALLHLVPGGQSIGSGLVTGGIFLIVDDLSHENYSSNENYRSPNNPHPVFD